MSSLSEGLGETPINRIIFRGVYGLKGEENILADNYDRDRHLLLEQ